jgi:hypothetical protein
MEPCQIPAVEFQVMYCFIQALLKNGRFQLQ